MLDVLDSVAGPEYVPAVLWTFGALVLLLIVLVIVKLIRSMTFGTFVAGGRNRKTRLAVMDATAIDSHRRLVLVRRDDIEHLLLIGGPTDVVVERDIRLVAPRRPALTGEGSQPRQQRAPQQPAPAPAPRSPQPANAAPAAPHRGASHPPVSHRETANPPAPPSKPVAQRYAPMTTSAPASAYSGNSNYARSSQPTRQQESIDDTLMKELEVSFDEPAPAKSSSRAPASLDDEMTRLLGELSNHKK